MAITSTGIGSGLDIESIITKLMSVEKLPLTALQTREASYQSKLTAFGSLKSALSTFQTAVKGLSNVSTFQTSSATVANTSIASATATSSAVAGSYTLEVGQLAQAQRLVATGQSSDTLSIGVGTITFDFGTTSGSTFTPNGSGSKTITIDSSNNSLAGMRDAINNANIGVAASIVNDGGASPYRLVLTSANSGSANSMKISATGTELNSLLAYDPAGTKNLVQKVASQDAVFTVNSIQITKSSNTITDAISGVTLNLLSKTATDTPTTLTIARDTASVTTAINSFVSAYNTINKTLKDAMAYNADTKTAAVLNGEASVRSIQAQLRAVLSTPISGGVSGYTVLSQVGVNLQRDGTLAVNSTKLASTLSTNFSDFAGLFAAAGKTSDSLVSFVSSTSNSKAGSYAVNVTQLATKGSIIGSIAAGTTIDSSNNTLSVQLDGKTATITLADGTYTAAALATEIQSKINGNTTFSSAGSTVKVTQSSGVLTLTSDLYGSASNVSILGGNGRSNLGLSASATVTNGLDVAGTINGASASGSGQMLLAATGDDSEGIRLAITGGSTGSRGTVNFSLGYAYQFNSLAGELLGSTGPVIARTDGLSSIIKRLEADQERFSTQLVAIEKRYRAQFTALDTMMSRLSNTSTYLTQQFDAMNNSSN